MVVGSFSIINLSPLSELLYETKEATKCNINELEGI